MLSEPSFAEAAGRVQQEMDAHDAGREGAELLDELAVTGAAVSRTAGRHRAARAARVSRLASRVSRSLPH